VGLFDRLSAHGYEQVVHCHDTATGLRAIIAIHSTVLGPALGGTRFYPFATDDEALTDVLRLARAMSYKAAVAGLALGGGKAVIIGDPHHQRTDALIESYARFVDSLGGRYVTAEDVGTTQADMDLVATITPHVSGTSTGSGDPSPATALGVVAAMRAVARHRFGDPDLGGRHVCVSGVGKVGAAVVDHLVAAGAKITVADVYAPAIDAVVGRHPDVDVVDPGGAHAVACDIFSPCALGAVLRSGTIGEMQCDAVCGSANNQLATDADADRLRAAGITYAPDYVVNAGGLINIFEELDPDGYDPERAAARVDTIEGTTSRVLATATEHGITTAAAADHLAEVRIAQHSANHVIRRFDTPPTSTAPT